MHSLDVIAVSYSLCLSDVDVRLLIEELLDDDLEFSYFLINVFINLYWCFCGIR
ncbi:MAG: hypothetical protein LBG52_01595 [Candidatus Peribacteria bacterium]|nr:hypothetical protein [Candidatus Peribacteria bacterium]